MLTQLPPGALIATSGPRSENPTLVPMCRSPATVMTPAQRPGTPTWCPAELPADTIAALQAAALTAHKAVGAFGYARSDFIVTEHGPTFLEINTLPGLTRSSLIPLELAAAKHPFESFMKAQIEQAIKRTQRG